MATINETRPVPNHRVQVESLTAKLVALTAALLCLALGLVGLVVPVLPGLLFLAIAAALIAKRSPSIERRIRMSARLGGYLDRADGLMRLGWRRQLRLGLLSGLKVLLTLIAAVASGLARFRGSLSGR